MLLGLFFTAAGANHFLKPTCYVALMPPFLHAHLILVYASGIAEIVCGLGVLFAKTRRLAAWGIVALLDDVYPAKLYHAFSGGLAHPDLSPMMANPVLAWVRLPLQFVFLAWAYWMTRPGRDRVESAAA
jgi:uncharacterized membrane protein